jgi:hypothetical protein
MTAPLRPQLQPLRLFGTAGRKREQSGSSRKLSGRGKEASGRK